MHTSSHFPTHMSTNVIFCLGCTLTKSNDPFPPLTSPPSCSRCQWMEPSHLQTSPARQDVKPPQRNQDQQSTVTVDSCGFIEFPTLALLTPQLYPVFFFSNPGSQFCITNLSKEPTTTISMTKCFQILKTEIQGRGALTSWRCFFTNRILCQDIFKIYHNRSYYIILQYITIYHIYIYITIHHITLYLSMKPVHPFSFGTFLINIIEGPRL